MNLEQAIEVLKKYVELDRDIRGVTDYTNDFDEFCEEKCTAIEIVLKELEGLNEKE